MQTCPQCKRTYTDYLEVEAIEDWGYCLGCDHINGETKRIEIENDSED